MKQKKQRRLFMDEMSDSSLGGFLVFTGKKTRRP